MAKINTTTNTITGYITSGIDEPKGVAFSPSGAYAYVTNFGSGNVAIINTVTGAVTGSINSGISNPYGVAFSPSGTYAYVANPVYNNVIIINTASNTVTGSITAGGTHMELQYLQTGHTHISQTNTVTM